MGHKYNKVASTAPGREHLLFPVTWGLRAKELGGHLKTS